MKARRLPSSSGLYHLYPVVHRQGCPIVQHRTSEIHRGRSVRHDCQCRSQPPERRPHRIFTLHTLMTMSPYSGPASAQRIQGRSRAKAAPGAVGKANISGRYELRSTHGLPLLSEAPLIRPRALSLRDAMCPFFQASSFLPACEVGVLKVGSKKPRSSSISEPASLICSAAMCAPHGSGLRCGHLQQHQVASSLLPKCSRVLCTKARSLPMQTRHYHVNISQSHPQA